MLQAVLGHTAELTLVGAGKGKPSCPVHTDSCPRQRNSPRKALFGPRGASSYTHETGLGLSHRVHKRHTRIQAEVEAG